MKARRPPAGWLLDGAFSAGFLAYAYFGINPRLTHHWQAPVFYLTADFIGEFFKYPGGLVDCLYALIAQLSVSQWLGALALTAQLAGITVLTATRCRQRPLLRFFPALLLIYPLNLYYDRTPLVLALLVGLAGGILFLRSGARLWIFGILLPAVYYVGGMALVFFGLMAAGIYIGRRDYWEGAAALLSAAALPILVERSGLVYIPAGARDWFTGTDSGKLAAWWGLYLFCGLIGFLSGRVTSDDRTRRSFARTALACAAVFGCFAGIAVISYRSNARDRRLAALDYHTSHENWAEVIAAAGQLPASDFNSLTRYEINLALHETHRMGDEMFRFPQKESTLPGLRIETFLPYMIRVTDLFLRLGRINDAEHFGTEAVIASHSDARILRLMTNLNLVKGQTEAARKYLNILSREAGSAAWARRYLRELDQDPELAGDESVQLLRRRMLQNDDVMPVWQNPAKPGADVNRLLASQLERDPSNRMAFEFLMGNYLLTRDLPSARALMAAIGQMTGPAYQGPDGRRRTPRHYQEAMAMYGDGIGHPVVIEGLEIEPETLNRMAVFKRIISQSAGRDAALQAAWSRFRDSYFFYFVFGPGDYR